MLASIFSLNVIQTALELGCIYALVALALFLSYSILNIADLSTDGCFTLGCAVACQVALTGHPFLALLAAMAAGVCSGFITAFLQTRLGVESIMAGIIVNTGLYTINLAVMGFSSTMSLVKTDTVFSIAKSALSFTGGGYKLVLAAVVIALAGAAMVGFLGTRLGLSIRATATKLGLSRQTVARTRDAYSIPSRPGRQPQFHIDIEWLREQYEIERRNAASIARELGCSPTTIRRYLRVAGLTHDAT